jgi:hypothetical protein
MWRRVAVVRPDVLEKRISSIIMAERISELGTFTAASMLHLLITADVVPSSLILSILMMEAMHIFEKLF